MSLTAHETIAWVDSYALDNELLDLDDDDQREEYDRLKKLIVKRQRRCKKERIGRESVLEVPKTACIVHVAVASDVIVTVNSQNKLSVSDISDTVKGGTWDIAQMFAQADDGSRRMIPNDRVVKLFLDPLGRQILLVFEKNTSALHVCLKNLPKEGEAAAKGNPSKHCLELRAATTNTSATAEITAAGQALLSGIGLGSLTSSSGGSGGGSGGGCPMIESLAWSPWNQMPASSGAIILGAKTGGQIWGARLEASGVCEVKRLFVLPNERSPITAVFQDRSRDPIDSRYLTVYVSTVSSLYIFFGKGSPESVFTHCTAEAITRADFLNHHNQSFHSHQQQLFNQQRQQQQQQQQQQLLVATSSNNNNNPTTTTSSSSNQQISSSSNAPALHPRRLNSSDQETIVIVIQCPSSGIKSSSSKQPSGAAVATTSTTTTKLGPNNTVSNNSSRGISLQHCHTSSFNCFWYSNVAEQQGMPGQWMWTHKEGVSFGSLPPPGFASSPVLNGTISYQSLLESQIQQQQLLSQLAPTSMEAAIASATSNSGGATANSAAATGSAILNSRNPIRVFSSCNAGFGIFLSTELGVSAMAHPAALPWYSSYSSGDERGGDKNRKWTMLNNRDNPDSDFGFNSTSGFGFNSLMQQNETSRGADSINPMKMDQKGGNNSQQPQQQQQNQNASIKFVSPLAAGDLKERTFHFMPAGSVVKDHSRFGGGFGAIRDATTSKVYLFTPLELFELHVPTLRRQMFPLFLEYMMEMASACLRAPMFSTTNTTSKDSASKSTTAGNKTGPSSPKTPSTTKSNTQQNLLQQQQQQSDFCSRLQAIRSCDLACRSYGTSETHRLGHAAGKSLAARLKFYNVVRSYGSAKSKQKTQSAAHHHHHHPGSGPSTSTATTTSASSSSSLERVYHAASDAEREVACSFLHAMHMCKTIAGPLKNFSILLARTASRCLGDMGAFSCAAPLLAEAHHQISVTEAMTLLSSSPAKSLSSQMHNDEIAIMERDRLLAYEFFGRQTIQRMNDERTIIGQYHVEIYCLVHWLVLVMMERCRRAEVHEDQVMTATGAESPAGLPLSPADLHEIDTAQQYVTDEAAAAVDHAQAAVRDMTCEQQPRFTVFRHDARSRQSMMITSGSSPTAASRTRANTFAPTPSASPGSGAGSGDAGNSASSQMLHTLLGALTLSVTTFIQHHMTTGHLSFKVIERALLAAASPRLSSLVFVIMQEFGVVLRGLIARGNFAAAARVLSTYCATSPEHSGYWRSHAQTLMAHCPLDFLSAEFVDNVAAMGFKPEDLVCMLAPAAYHNIKYSGTLVHTQMCRAVVAVLRAYLNAGNPNHKSLTLEKQTVMMMTLHNANDELVDFISSALEADYLDLEEEEVASRRGSFSGFALRQCAKAARVAGLAEVLFRQGLCFDAVRLLVHAGLMAEARDYAHRVPSKDEQHKCWFEIVRCGVVSDPIQGSNDALEFLKESDGVLSVYDVFPELSEAVPMKALGQGLIEAVNEVAIRMKQTQYDVETARQITQRERAQGDRVRHGTVNVGVDKACDVCKAPLLGNTDEFLLYPACGHGFHIGCHKSTGNDGLMSARDHAPAGTLMNRCPLCSTERGLADFLTTPIELPFGHPAHNFAK